MQARKLTGKNISDDPKTNQEIALQGAILFIEKLKSMEPVPKLIDCALTFPA
jgi:hypothetical protein